MMEPGVNNIFKAAKNNNLQYLTKVSILHLKECIEVINVLGETLLMLAAREGHVAIVRFLLKAGANPLARSLMGCSVITLAISSGSQDTVNLLLRYDNVLEAASGDNLPPLCAAAMMGRLNLVKVLLKFNVNNCVAKGGMTPLMLATIFNHISTVSYLEQFGNYCDFVNEARLSACFMQRILENKPLDTPPAWMGTNDGFVFDTHSYRSGSQCNENSVSDKPIKSSIIDSGDHNKNPLKPKASIVKRRNVHLPHIKIQNVQSPSMKQNNKQSTDAKQLPCLINVATPGLVFQSPTNQQLSPTVAAFFGNVYHVCSMSEIGLISPRVSPFENLPAPPLTTMGAYN